MITVERGNLSKSPSVKQLATGEITKKPSISSQSSPTNQDRPFLNAISENILSALNSNRNIKTIDIETYMTAPEMDDESIFVVSYGVRVYAIDNNGQKEALAHIPVFSRGDGGWLSGYASKTRQYRLLLAEELLNILRSL